MPLFGGPNIEKMKAKGDVIGLVKALGHKTMEKRRDAARALGELGDARAVERLIETVEAYPRDVELAVAEAAVTALGQIGDKAAVKPIETSLGWQELRACGVEALGNIRDPQAMRALGKIGDQRAVERLIEILEAYPSWETPVTKAAITALGQIGDSAGVKPIITALGWHDLVACGVEALGYIGDPDAVEILANYLEFGPLGWDDYSARVRKNAAVALGKIGEAGVVAIIQRLTEKTPVAPGKRPRWEEINRRKRAAEALGNIGHSRALDVLIPALNDELKEVREKGAWALGQIRDARGIGPLVPLLEDEEREVRQAAALALDRLGWKPTDDAEKVTYLKAKGVLEALANLAKGYSARQVSLLSGQSADTIWSWVREAAQLHKEVVGQALKTDYEVSSEQLDRLWSFVGR